MRLINIETQKVEKVKAHLQHFVAIRKTKNDFKK